MAIPSGSGSEILTSNFVQAVSNSWITILTGVNLHIFTIVSVVFSNMTANAEQIRFKRVDSDGSSNEHWLMEYGDIPAYGTFVWNDKFVITGDKKLVVATSSAADIDVVCSFIDQNWT